MLNSTKRQHEQYDRATRLLRISPEKAQVFLNYEFSDAQALALYSAARTTGMSIATFNKMAKPEFNAEQIDMLKHIAIQMNRYGVSADWVFNPKKSVEWMKSAFEIALQHGGNIPFPVAELDYEQLEVIQEALSSSDIPNELIPLYARPEFSAWQMRVTSAAFSKAFINDIIKDPNRLTSAEIVEILGKDSSVKDKIDQFADVPGVLDMARYGENIHQAISGMFNRGLSDCGMAFGVKITSMDTAERGAWLDVFRTAVEDDKVSNKALQIAIGSQGLNGNSLPEFFDKARKGASDEELSAFADRHSEMKGDVECDKSFRSERFQRSADYANERGDKCENKTVRNCEAVDKAVSRDDGNDAL